MAKCHFLNVFREYFLKICHPAFQEKGQIYILKVKVWINYIYKNFAICLNIFN